MTNDDRLAYLIARHFGGDGSPEEHAELRALADADPAIAAYIETLRTARAAAWPLGEARRPDADRLLADLRRRLPVRQLRGGIARRPPTRPGAWYPPSSAGRIVPAIATAAVVAIGVVGSWAYVRRAHLARIDAPRVQYVAARGQRLSVTLPDSSQVALGPASSLTYVSSAESGRALTLAGEAYFTVRHDPTRPFSVQAGNAITRDIGTKFFLRSYASDTDVQLLVTEGTVSLRTATRADTHALGRNALAMVGRTGDVTVTTVSSVGPYVAWATGKLEFHNTPLGRVLDDLGRWYDLDIVVVDSTLATIPIRGALPTTTINDALDVLTGAVGATWKRDGRSVWIARRHRMQRAGRSAGSVASQ